MQLYFADYIRQWDGFLADVRLVPLGSLDQAARVTNALAGADSPLRALLQAAARETTLEGVKTAGAQGTVDKLVRDKLNAARRQLESALGSAEEAAPAAPLHPVDQHFAALHKLAGGAAPTLLDQTLALLKDVALYFDAAESARRSGTPAPSGDALVRLKRGGEGQPAPLSTLLQNIDNGGNGLALGSERARLNALWSGSGAQFCRDAIAGRYPLVRTSARDATADDFGKFFGPGGLMDDFFSKNLAAFVDMSGGQWRWRSTAGPAGVSQEALDQFQRGARLRDMFFGAGGRQPSLRFDLKVANIDPAFSQLTLDIDGQPLAFQAGQALRSAPMLLPSGKGNGQVRFDGVPALRSDLRTEGPWAWLRMVDRGALETIQGERFRLTFDFDGRKAVYELTASSVINPFRRETLEQFRCPASL
jgi:type VI secretion system protein ImpL